MTRASLPAVTKATDSDSVFLFFLNSPFFIRIVFITLSYNLLVMDAKVTLSFNKAVIEKAKQYAEAKNMSLSRMLELILDKITSNQYSSIEDFPISDWVLTLSEGAPEYTSVGKNKGKLKTQYRSRKK